MKRVSIKKLGDLWYVMRHVGMDNWARMPGEQPFKTREEAAERRDEIKRTKA